MAKKRDFTPNQLANLRIAVSLREESSMENDEKADETMWRKLREKIESMMPEENPRACALPGELSTEARGKLPAMAFGLPKERKYPMYTMSGKTPVPSGSHASNAKARAQAQYDEGNLSYAKLKQIDKKADKVLAACGTKGKKRTNPARPWALVKSVGMDDRLMSTHTTEASAEKAMRKAGGEPNSAFQSGMRIVGVGPDGPYEVIRVQGRGTVRMRNGARASNPGTPNTTAALVGKLKF